MRARALAALLVLVPAALAAQAAPAPAAAPSPTPAPAAPSTDVWIVALDRAGDAWKLGAPSNLTHRAGYDNQPSFLPDGGHLLYTSQRGEQADIFELDLATGAERAVTATPESEYSPTLAADGGRVLVVRVEPDGTQRLWSFPLAGGAPALVAPEARGVGYQAWIDATRVAVFVLGEPFTLQIVDTKTGAARRVAEKIGRSIHRVPGTSSVSFTAPDGDGFAIWAIDADDPAAAAKRLAPAPASEEKDYAWTSDGVLVAAVEAKLYRLRPGVDAGWVEIGDLSAGGVKGITRLALSPDGTRLAFVAAE